MIERVDLGEIPYDDDDARRMAGWVAERRGGTVGDRLFLLSHPPVITYGPRTAAEDLPGQLGLAAATRRGAGHPAADRRRGPRGGRRRAD
ncbi:MAG TPA: hypothetical protein VGP57_09835 [Actinoplanes sp.]|nr:hypothetical protein [Actinoplanes sp.]